MADSTVTGNSALSGGGLRGGNMLIRSSTIADNSATYGGGILNIALERNPMRLLGSTESGNTTTATSGGGLYTGGSWAQVGGTIFQGNSAPQCDGGTPSRTSLGYNLSSDSSCVSHATDLSGVIRCWARWPPTAVPRAR